MKKFFIRAIFLTAIIYIVLAAALPSMYVAPILKYHHIAEKADLLHVPPRNFDWQMKFLRDGKYNVVRLGELVDLITQNKKIPPKTVAITFDDGYDDNFTNAYPILKKYNMPATMFVIPNHCGWDGYLSRRQIKELAAAGIDIGSHTLNDIWLPNCGDAKLIEEIAGSKMALEEITGKRVDFISYPLGGFDQRVRLAVMKAGYKAGLGTKTGKYNSRKDIYALKRAKVSGKKSDSLIKFWFNASGYSVWFKEHKKAHKNKKT